MLQLPKTTSPPRKSAKSTAAGWVAKLDAFLAFNERDILTHAGNISLAQERAHAEFEKYEAQCCRIEATTPTSDFDRFVVKTR